MMNFLKPPTIRSVLLPLMLLLVPMQAAYAATIQVTNPNSAKTWYKNNQYFVTWLVTDVKAQRVKIDLMQGSNVILAISGPVKKSEPGQNFGKHLWTVPTNLPGGAGLPDGQYQVRVQTTNKSVEDLSQVFWIRGVIPDPPDPYERPQPVPGERFEPAAKIKMLDIMKTLSGRCDSYAKLSMFAQDTNRLLKCGFKGADWSGSYRDHFDWCMARIVAKPTEAKARHEEMFTQLQTCTAFYNVTMTLTKIEIHDDCDNVSVGDWYVSLGSSATTTLGPKRDFATWPGTTSAQNVSSGNTYNTNINTQLTLKGNARLELSIGAVDCDGSPGSWFWPLIGIPAFVDMATAIPFEQSLSGVDCGGEEEVWEFSSGNDFLGYTTLKLTPDKWKNGGNFKIVAGQEAIDACESDGPPYTAHITLQTKRR